jgi:hypothetical protein
MRRDSVELWEPLTGTVMKGATASLSFHLHCLASGADARWVASQPRVSRLASEDDGLFRDYGAFEDWPRAQGELRLNPLFVPESRKDQTVVVRRHDPSDWYAAENSEFALYWPEKAELSLQQIADLAAGKRNETA